MTGNKRTQTGFTLIEILVALSIFIVVMLITTGIYQSALVNERRSLANKNIQENLQYSLEVMSKEIRMATQDDGTCLPTLVDFVYESNGSENALYFRNQDDECVAYSLETDPAGIGRIKLDRDGSSAYVTSSETDIKSLKFIVNQTRDQELVTMNIEASAKNNDSDNIIIQTSLSSRFY